MFKQNDLTKQKGWVCVMEDGSTIEVESFSEALKIPNYRALMSSQYYPQYTELTTPKRGS